MNRMLLKKMVDEFGAVISKMNAAQKEFGNYHYLVIEYKNQLDELRNQYFGISKTDSRMKKER
ncbi:hypothetical protein [Gottfriedia acidiceleris]|uniref:hypothetical protein n=1 Tax=Gottfriedia acidiceleris TaxID=371036 RepID=UPI003D218DE3